MIRAGPPRNAVEAGHRPEHRDGVGGLLRQRRFRLLWIGETISQLGNAMAVVGVPLVAVIVLHASTFTIGVLRSGRRPARPACSRRSRGSGGPSGRCAPAGSPRGSAPRGLLMCTLGAVPSGLLIPLTGPGPRLAFYVAGALLGGALGTALGIRAALRIMLGAVTLSGTLLLTPAFTGRRDLPARPPAARRPGQRELAPRGHAGV